MIKEKGMFTITPIQVILVSKVNLCVLSSCGKQSVEICFACQWKSRVCT